MTRILICLCVVMSIAASAAWAQDPAPTTPTQPEVTTTPERLPPVDPPQSEVAPTTDPVPPTDPSQLPPQWTYERQMQNQQGTVTNTHRYLDAREDGRYVREHVVTNPRGEMTQTWERVNTEDGYEYRRSQVWLNPDGTPLRQHDRTMSVRSWTPDEPIAGQMATMPEPVQPATVPPTTPQPTIAPPASQPTEQLSWWQKLNPFRKRGNPTAGSAAASAPRRGFTVGIPNSNSARPSSLSSGDHPSVNGSQNTHRPSWAGGAPRSMSPQGPPAHANSNATASRPNPGRGPNR
jgi:hypothetical protein